MTIAEIVKDYLKREGYDGLYQSGECACLADDLMPCCEDSIADCEAGYKVDCTAECFEAHERGGWHIQAEKPEGTREARSEPCVFPGVPDPDP